MAKISNKKEEKPQEQPKLVPQTPEQVLNEVIEFHRKIANKKVLMEDLTSEKADIEKEIKELQNDITGLETSKNQKLDWLAGGQQQFGNASKNDLKDRVMNQANVKTPEQLRAEKEKAQAGDPDPTEGEDGKAAAKAKTA